MQRDSFLKYAQEHELEFLQYIIKKAGIGSWIRDNVNDLAQLDEGMIKMWGMEGIWEPGQWVPFVKEMLPKISGMSKKDQAKLEGVFSGKDKDDLIVIEHEINRPDGSVINCEVRIEVHSRDDSGLPIAITGVNIDTSELLLTKKKAYTDNLTKAWNRNKLYSLHEKSIKVDETQVGRLIMLLDLDNFKEINDTQGHQIGDLALQSFSKAMYTSMRDSDNIFRLGGDEFLIITSCISLEKSHIFIKRLLDNLSKVSRPASLSSSIGAVYIMKDITLDRALSVVDKELYNVKNSNKGYYSLVKEEV